MKTSSDRSTGLLEKDRLLKKSLIEKAVRAYLEQMGEKPVHDILDRSFGARTREEAAQETLSRAREAFNRSFERGKEPSQ